MPEINWPPADAKAREVLIWAFTRPSLHHDDLPGLALAFAGWLGIAPPEIAVTNGRFRFVCASSRAARLIQDQWGGNAVGTVLSGAIADLTF